MDSEADLVSEHEEADRKNFFSRLCGVWFSPKETFERMKKSPDLLLPILFLVIIGLFGAWYITKNVDIAAGLAEQMEKAVEQGKITREQAQQQLAVAGQFVVIPIFIMGMIGSILAGLLIAAYAKLFSMLSGAENGFKALFSVTLYALLAVSIVQTAVMVLVLQLRGPSDVDLTNMSAIVASNLGAMIEGFFGADVMPKFLISLARAVDLFAIWIIALLAMGYPAVSTKLKLSHTAVWLVAAYVVVVLIGAAVSGISG